MRITSKGITETNKHLQEMIARAKSLKPAMDAGALDVKTLIDDAFYKSIDPTTGNPWQDLAESTKESRRKGNGGGLHKILVDTGRLRGSITATGFDKSIVYGTNVAYGAVHQKGGVKVPQRKFLPDSFDAGPALKVADRIRKRILNYITKGTAKL